MSTPILATKLYIPPPRPNTVSRPRLIKRLNEDLCQNRGVGHKLTLISAPAGFGKTTLLSEWVTGCERPAAWLSLDEGDSDPNRFLTYLIAALRTVRAGMGEELLGMLQSPQLPSPQAILTILLNEITSITETFILVLDDYHAINAKPVDEAIAFLLDHLPPQMRLVIATREDPDLPLARYRAQDQLAEVRAADLRFTPTEAAEFLNQAMGLTLSTEDISALESRTEGWIAGLQLAAISMQGHEDAASFIKLFTGSHRFVMDYLVEEVLRQQSERVQMFLLQTSILDRLCGPLCEAVLRDPSTPGQETLEYLERTNLFIVPLDNERRWYRYHHLFADLLRQRLRHNLTSQAVPGDAKSHINELHIRASQWYEDHGLMMEAFHHAAAAHDVERAERLIEGDEIPRHFHGAVKAILDWLKSLPLAVLNARPSLWWKYASLLLIAGQTTGVEEKLQAAEASLQGLKIDDKTRNLIGQIAAARATLALTRYDVEAMFAQSRRALEYLHPDSLSTRSSALWTLGYAYILLGERVAARRALTEAISLSQASGNIFFTILATIGLGNVQEADNQLRQAAETYRHVLQLVGDQPQQIISEVHLGLARVLYEWNDLHAAEQHTHQSLQLARQYDTAIIDRFVFGEVFLARLKLAQGDVTGAAAILAKTDQFVRQHNFVYRVPEVVAAQVLTHLHQGNLEVAAHLAQTHDLPLSQVRVHLARGNASAALAILKTFRQQVEAKGWQDERLKTMVLEAIAHHAQGEKEVAMHSLREALALAEPGGFIRIFLDEGLPIAQLMSEVVKQGIMPEYTGKLLAAFEGEKQKRKDQSSLPSNHTFIEPLSQRELEVLRLIAQGLSNQEISERLFLALDTVKGHNRRIFDKLQVQRRTEAVARARELGLL